MADTFFVGQTGDPLQVATVSLTNPIFILFMAFANMFEMGGSAAASIASCKLCCKIRSMIRTIVNIVLDPVMISGFPTAIFSVLMSVSTIVLNQVLVVYGNAPVAAIAGLNGVIYGQALTDIISILLSIVLCIKCRKRI